MRSPSSSTSADWTPDGKQLAVLRFLEGRNRIELPARQGALRLGARHSCSRVSPRGDRIAIARDDLRPGIRCLTVDLAGKSTTLVGTWIRGQGLAWSPSGDEVWFDDRRRARPIPPEGRGPRGPRARRRQPPGRPDRSRHLPGRPRPRRAVRQPARHPRSGSRRNARARAFLVRPIVSRSALSDDGRLLLFNEFGDAAGRAGAYYLRKTDGSPAVKLGEGAGLDLSSRRQVGARTSARLEKCAGARSDRHRRPRHGELSTTFERASRTWRPLLSRMASACCLPGAEPGSKRRLYVQDLPSGKPRPITRARLRIRARPHLSGRTLGRRLRGVDGRSLLLIRIGGGEPRTVPNTKDLDLIRWTPDGKFIFAAVSGSIPARVVRVEVATGQREPWKTWRRRSARGSSRSSPSS